jgi:hypothetical protein
MRTAPRRAGHLLAALTPVVSLLALNSCQAGATKPPARAKHTPEHVDSVIPREVALQRFQEGLREPKQLSGGAGSMDALIRRFLEGVKDRDTAELRRLLLDRAEFAYLYYPTTPQSLPPYDLSPTLMWFLLSERSGQGLTKALQSLGGKPFHYSGYECDPKPSREGANTVWGPCLVRLELTPSDTGSVRLFGLVIEREGRYKFVSYSNKLD